MTTQISGTNGVNRVQNDAVEQDDLKLAASSVGVGQTWQLFTGSRALSTDYTNNTGKPIQLSITIVASVNTYADLVIDGVNIGRIASQSISGTIDASTQAIIPNGATYRLNPTGGVSIRSWAELR